MLFLVNKVTNFLAVLRKKFLTFIPKFRQNIPAPASGHGTPRWAIVHVDEAVVPDTVNREEGEQGENAEARCLDDVDGADDKDVGDVDDGKGAMMLGPLASAM